MINYGRDSMPKVSARDFPLTEHERFWVEVIREASRDSDPPPSLRLVRLLRRIFRGTRPTDDWRCGVG
jgi:hypothetical protein